MLQRESEIKQDHQCDKELSEGPVHPGQMTLWNASPVHASIQPISPLVAMIHDEFCRFVGCKSEKEIKLHLTLYSFSPFQMISVLHMLNLMFNMFYCLQYIFQPH